MRGGDSYPFSVTDNRDFNYNERITCAVTCYTILFLFLFYYEKQLTLQFRLNEYNSTRHIYRQNASLTLTHTYIHTYINTWILKQQIKCHSGEENASDTQRGETKLFIFMVCCCRLNVLFTSRKATKNKRKHLHKRSLNHVTTHVLVLPAGVRHRKEKEDMSSFG